ncbi:hypothetical protein JOB18_033472, partial [Solea senegalensis]
MDRNISTAMSQRQVTECVFVSVSSEVVLVKMYYGKRVEAVRVFSGRDPDEKLDG